MSGSISDRVAFSVGFVLAVTLGACTGTSDVVSPNDGGKTNSEQPPDDGPTDAGKQAEPDGIPPAVTDASIPGTDSGASVADASIEALDANETGTEDAGWPPQIDFNAPEFRCTVEGCCFGEGGLAEAVRNVLGRRYFDKNFTDQLTNSDIESIIAIDWRDFVEDQPPGMPAPPGVFVQGPIRTLEGIECLPNLETLWINMVEYLDPAPLAAASKLRNLNIMGVQTRNLDFLAALENLEEIRAGPSIYWNEEGESPSPEDAVIDISGLKNHAKLRKVTFEWVMDISALEGKQELEEVVLYGSPIKRIDALASTTALKKLNIGETCVEDLSPLVANGDFSTGDWLDVTRVAMFHSHSWCDSLIIMGGTQWCNTQRQNIETLRARGVSIETDCMFE